MSHVDGLLVGACVQRFIRFMVWKPFFEMRAFHWLLRRANAIPVGTGGPRDMVESIREFDVLSQRSIRELQTANIVASLHYNYSDNADLSQTQNFSDEKETRMSLFEYLSSDALLLFDEPVLVEKEIEELQQEGYSNILNWEMIEKKVAKPL